MHDARMTSATQVAEADLILAVQTDCLRGARQKKLAKEIGISQPQLSRILSGDSRIGPKTLEALRAHYAQPGRRSVARTPAEIALVAGLQMMHNMRTLLTSLKERSDQSAVAGDK